MDIDITNPMRLNDRQARDLFRKIHSYIWDTCRDMVDGKESLNEATIREIAYRAIEVTLGKKAPHLLNPELQWNATIKRRGFRIMVEPLEGRVLPTELTDE